MIKSLRMFLPTPVLQKTPALTLFDLHDPVQVCAHLRVLSCELGLLTSSPEMGKLRESRKSTPSPSSVLTNNISNNSNNMWCVAL